MSGAADASSGGEGVIPMLVGFTGGQIQLVDPVRKELSKLYNEERLVEQSRFVDFANRGHTVTVQFQPEKNHHVLLVFSSMNISSHPWYLVLLLQ